jgi:hypothetical protein
MPRLCLMIVRLTPTRSKADHAKTSLLQLRQERSLASSFGERSLLIAWELRDQGGLSWFPHYSAIVH